MFSIGRGGGMHDNWIPILTQIDELGHFMETELELISHVHSGNPDGYQIPVKTKYQIKSLILLL